MGYVIAVAGKGGVGKTTLAAALVRVLTTQGRTPVLAVDADPNQCLDRLLGVEAAKTVGGLREDANQSRPEGMDKRRYLELLVAQSLVEGPDFDLIAMGRPEGPGCYCYANNVLKDVLGQIVDEYPFVVLDNEAGLENLSRRLVTKVNTLALVADPSARGLETLRRIHALSREMDINYERLVLVVNRLRTPELPAKAYEIQEETNADALLGIETNTELAELDEAGLSIWGLSEENATLLGAEQILPQR